jgi:hypothetical protein
LLKLKTTSGSHSGLDTSIQPKKQAQKSHATVLLKWYDWIEFNKEKNLRWFFLFLYCCFDFAFKVLSSENQGDLKAVPIDGSQNVVLDGSFTFLQSPSCVYT